MTWIRTNSVTDWKLSIRDISYGKIKIYENRIPVLISPEVPFIYFPNSYGLFDIFKNRILKELNNDLDELMKCKNLGEGIDGCYFSNSCVNVTKQLQSFKDLNFTLHDYYGN